MTTHEAALRRVLAALKELERLDQQRQKVEAELKADQAALRTWARRKQAGEEDLPAPTLHHVQRPTIRYRDVWAHVRACLPVVREALQGSAS
ncbi:hypothetical protein [Deinococcus aluminii]|uniref:Uncharacterized protein n=1 Tax=Deinococcus aluminii TaxID=1656885 RepID=A0ABP9XGE7_9DEIO